MLDGEAYIDEIAIQPPQCSQFPLADSQGAIEKYEELVAKFELG